MKQQRYFLPSFTKFSWSFVYARITVISREKRDFWQIEVVVEVSEVTIAKKFQIGPKKNLIWRNDKTLNFLWLEVGQLFFSKPGMLHSSMVTPKNDIFSEKMRCGKIFQCPPKFLKLEYENNFKKANVKVFPQLDRPIVWFLGKMKLPNFFFKISRTFYYRLYMPEWP